MNTDLLAASPQPSKPAAAAKPAAKPAAGKKGAPMAGQKGIASFFTKKT